MLFVCSQEKLKTMVMQNFGVTNKEHYGILWYFSSGQLTVTWMTIRMSTIKLNTNCIKKSFPGFSPTRPYGAREVGERTWERGLNCICLRHLASNAWSLQQNSQSERVLYCSHIMKENYIRLAANQSARTIEAV